MRNIVIVMGVAGCGKSTVGALLAARIGAGFVDGDSVHTPEAVAKMAAGHPLTDEDRWPWLDRIGAHLADEGRYPGGLVVACSALRRRYRDRLRSAAGNGLAFVFLEGNIELIRTRLAARQGHYMPPSLLDSQFAALEPPLGERHVLAVSIDKTPSEIADIAARWLTDPEFGR